MYNILLLGGTGFIGKNIIESFINDENCNLFVVSRDLERIHNPIFTGKRVTVLIGSLNDHEFIEKLIDDYNVNVIVHLASSLIPSSSESDFLEGMNSIIIPTFRLIDFISNKDIKFLFFSSGGTIYGNASLSIKESDALNPINNYGFSKLVVEKYIRYKSNTSALKSIILRPSNVYGKHQSFAGSQGFISVAINKIYNQSAIEIWGDGNSIRDYIHVDDVALVVKKLLFNSKCNITVNLSTGRGFSLLQIIKMIEYSMQTKAIINFQSKRIVDVDTVILDNSKLLKIISHNFITLSDGIEDQIKYFKKTVYDRSV